MLERDKMATFFTLVATADLRSLLYTRCFSDSLCLCLAFWAATMVRNPLLEEGRHLSVPAGQQISYQNLVFARARLRVSSLALPVRMFSSPPEQSIKHRTSD